MGEATVSLAQLPWTSQLEHEMTLPLSTQGVIRLSVSFQTPHASGPPLPPQHDRLSSDTALTAAAAAAAAAAPSAAPVASSNSAGGSVSELQGGEVKLKKPSKELRREALGAAAEKVGKGVPAGSAAGRRASPSTVDRRASSPAGRRTSACDVSCTSAESESAKAARESNEATVTLAGKMPKRVESGALDAAAHAPAAAAHAP